MAAAKFSKGIIQPTLIDQLRGILEQYPDDNQILKELIQNAEDAGATKVTFLYDRTQYGCDKLHRPALKDYQGPALYAFNDAQFSEADWKSVRMIHNSLKKDDPMKLGRFGLGFKSVFHITDLPGVLSGNLLGFLDPHESFFETITEGGRPKKTSSFAWNLSDSELHNSKSDQLAPFKQALFGNPDIAYDSHFPGTLFRFPLRQKNSESEISKTEYNDVKIHKLFDMFRYEAHKFLLFLNSLEQIEIYEKNRINEEPRLLLSVKVSQASRKEVRQQRTRFKSGISSLSPTQRWLPQPVVAKYRLETEVDRPGSPIETKTWLVTQYCDGGNETSLKRILLQNSAKMLPWVGVALPLTVQGQSDETQGQLGKGKGHAEGQVFCFLPLPAEQRSATGFHFHVHGYFAVDQNRRHLKWPSADYSKAKHKDYEREWNSKMASELVPRALRQLVLQAIKNDEEPANVLKLFPDPNAAQAQWSAVVEPFYNLIASDRVSYTEERGGRWILAKDACVLDQNDKHKDLLKRTLLNSSLVSNLVKPPQYVLDAMPQNSRPKKVDPGLMKQHVMKMDTSRLSSNERAELVQYFAEKKAFVMLNELKLCQLEDGGLTTFATECYHLADDLRPLLPGLLHKCHAPAPGKTYNEALTAIAKSETTSLKGKTNSDLPNLLSEMFSESRKPISLNDVHYQSKHSFSVDETWLDKIWKFIDRNSFTTSLSRYEGLPLLLSGTKVYSLSKDKPYIRHDLHDTNMDAIFQQIGFVVVDNFHPKAEDYVHTCDQDGVLLGLESIPDYVDKVKQLADSDKRNLRKFLSNISYSLSHSVLVRLPLFETCPALNETNDAITEWVSVSGTSKGFVGIPCVALTHGTQVIDLQDDDARRLGQTVKVKVITEMQLVSQYILPNFEKYTNRDDKINITSHLVENQEKYKGIEGKLKTLDCIPTTTGDFKAPVDIFDPTDEKVKTLFGDLDILSFPSHEFTDQVMLIKLRRLGMRGIDQIETSHLFKLAQYIDMHADKTSSQAKDLGKALCEYLNANHHFLSSKVKKDGAMLKNAIAKLRIVPFATKIPHDYDEHIKWYDNEGSLVRPCDISKHYHLTGSQMPYPDVEANNLERAFSWNKRPTVDTVLAHFEEVIFSGGNGPELLPCVIKIYTYLQEEFHGKTDWSKLAGKLKEYEKWIWSESGFVNPGQMVLKSDLGICVEPYIYVCSTELKQFKQLLSTTGVRQSVNWFEVLERIRNHHEQSPSPSEYERDKSIVMAILSKIAESGQLDEDLLIPIDTGNSKTLMLKPRSQCTYCDSEWMQKGNREEDIDDLGDDIFIIHSEVSQKLATSLEVPSFMSRYLDAEELDMSYGQSEPLTRRIHNILDDYKDGSAVLKELLQNADDAGATEVAFVYDKRNMEQNSEKLLDKNMRSLQGPAIWAYNDAVFSDSDFQNIVKLSGETKKEQATKIGRFGLGFNAVYHLTDVPSFVSRDSIVIFDPHTKYLGQSIKAQTKPGIKLSLNKHAKRIEKFSDQFSPYKNIFGLDLSTSFDGTLFRLPLRTEAQAIDSEISNKVYNDTEVSSLFDLLYKGADSLLLFTQCVQKVSVYTIDASETDSPNMKQEFVIERSIEHVIKRMRPADSDGPHEEPKILHLKNKIDSASSDNHSNCYIEKVTISGDLLGRNKASEDKTYHWIVASAIGKGESRSMAKTNPELVPVGGVACRLDINSETKKYYLNKMAPTESQIFCFLPLPIRLGLPLHVNGYFAVTSSRNQLHDDEETEKSDTRAKWNRALMEDAVCTAYLEMLCLILQPTNQLFDKERTCDTIFDFFPQHMEAKVSGRSNPAFCLMNAFLKQVFVTGDRQILPCSGNEFVNGKGFLTLDRDAKSSKINQQMIEVCNEVCLTTLKKSFVDLPSSVYVDLEICGFVDKISNRFISIETFYRKIFLPNVNKLPLDITEALLLYALSSCGQRYDDLLVEYQCIPVFAPGDKHTFVRPEILVDPKSNMAQLFDQDEGFFPLPLIEKKTNESGDVEQWRAGLLRLGMRDKTLSNPEVLVRAKSIEKLSDHKQAVQRSDCLLLLLDEMKKDDLVEIGPELQVIPFISKQSRPKEWLLKWKSDDDAGLLSLESVCDDDFDFMGAVCTKPHFDQISSMRRMRDIKKKLGISAKLQVADIKEFMEQCAEFIETKYDPNEKKYGITSTSYNLRKLIWTCYDWCKANDSNIDLTHFKDTPFIFVNEGSPVLVKPSKCFKKLQTDCKPFLYKVPSDLVSCYPTLITSLSIKEECESQVYVEILQQLHAREKAVPEQDRNIILNIIKALAASLHSLSETCANLAEERDKLGNIYVVNDEWELCLNTELNYNTIDWLTTDDKSQLCNMDLTLNEALALGVKTTRDAVIDEFTLGVSFGQHEELTSRIKRLLDGYPCDREVLKELLQNADDAGASEIHFILDGRTHKSDRLFADTWKHLQGPALLVYNDRPFKEKDIDGIQKLGEGSKGDDAVTTGKYGVGFNCVYHLTDTPTFLSKGEDIGERLCAFDPQCRYVPASGRRNPGRMFKVDKNLRSKFPDVFSCYDIPEVNKPESTLFRLPLRSKDIANDSQFGEYSKNGEDKIPVTAENVRTLFDRFREEMPIILLFLRNVKKITLSETTAEGTLQVISTTEASMSAKDSSEKDRYNAAVAKAGRTLKDTSSDISQISATEAVYRVTIDSDERSQNFIVCQRIGFTKHDAIPVEMIDEYKRHKAALLPRGGVAYFLGTNKTKHRKKHEKDESSSQKKEDVAAKDKIKPKLFSFLPLPQDSNLPMHINGQFILDGETRHDIFETDKCESFKSQWNQLLFSMVISRSYISALEEIKGDLPSTPTHYSNIQRLFRVFARAFPYKSMTTLRPLLSSLQRSIFCNIINQEHTLIPVMRRQEIKATSEHFPLDETVQLLWKSAKDKVFFDTLEAQMYVPPSPSASTETRDTPTQSPGSIVKNVLLNLHFSFTVLPKDQKGRFAEAVKSDTNKQEGNENPKEERLTINSVSPTDVVEYLVSYKTNEAIGLTLPCAVEHTPFLTPESVRHILNYVSKCETLEGLPLLLTNDEVLREFQKTQHHVLATPYHSLVPGAQHIFLHRCFGTSSNLQCQQIEKVFSPYVKSMTVSEFASVLDQHLDAAVYRDESRVDAKISPIDENWMSTFYQFLYSQIFSLDGTAIDSEKLEPLQNWCLVPAMINDQLVYTKFADVGLLFKAIYSELPVLEKLPLPRIHTTSTQTAPSQPKGIWEVLRKLVANTNESFNLLKSLTTHLKTYTDLHEIIKSSEAESVLDFFGKRIFAMTQHSDYRELLRELPLHNAISGQLVKLGNKRVVCVPANVNRAELHKLPNDQDVFIEMSDSEPMQDLYKFIGCSHTTFDAFYIDCVLPNASKLTDSALQEHMRKVRFYLETRGYAQKHIGLVSALQKVPFINNNEKRCKASEFFNPDLSLFKKLQKEDDFPSAPYDTEEWRPFLKRLGLISEVTTNMYVAYAQKIASKELPSDPCAKALVKDIFKQGKQLTLRQMSSIKFMIAEKVPQELIDIAPVVSSELISYSSSADKKYAEQCWTVLPILQDWAIPHVDQLGLVPKPPNDKVIQHMKNLVNHCEHSLATKNQATIEKLQQIFVDCITRIGSNGIRQNDISQLKRLKCVISDNGLFLKPPLIVSKIEKEWSRIQPWVLEIPRKYVQVEKTLKSLGMTDEISLKQAIKILKNLYDISKGTTLNPNVLDQAIIATKLLFSLAHETTGTLKFKSLYLPTKEKGMVASQDVVLVDEESYLRRRFKLDQPTLVKLDVAHKNERDVSVDVQWDIVERFPEPLRPKILSNMVEERLDESCLMSRQPCLMESQLSNKLHGGSLCDCILRILKHNAKKQMTSGEENARLAADVEKVLSDIKVVGIAEIMTYLWQDGDKIKESGMSLSFFIKKNDSEGGATVYVTSKTDAFLLSFKLAEHIAKLPLFQGQALFEHYLSHVIREPHHKMHKILDDLQITTSSASARSKDRPEPGNYVDQKYIGMLEQSHAKLAIGEYVAFEVDDPLLEDTVDNATDQPEATYMYVRIVEVVIDDNTEDPSQVLPINYKYKVDNGSDTHEVIDAVYLYRFREKRVDSDGAEQAMALMVHSNPDQSQFGSQPTTDSAKQEEPESKKSLEEIKAYITECLLAAEKKDERARRAIWKRLRFEFHPDKNPDRSEIATEAFKFLQNQIERLERGEDIRETTNKETEEKPSGGGRSSSSYEWFFRQSDHFSSRARQHEYQREEFREYNFFDFDTGSEWSHRHEKYRANPQPGLAKRWMQQASHDLQAVSRDTKACDQEGGATANDDHDVPYEWACFKSYQAAKKATRAAQYKVDASKTDPQLSTLRACGCQDKWSRLKRLIGSEDAMQYPARGSLHGGVPRDRYTAAMATQAQALATEIVQACRGFINDEKSE